jgi:Flp pilus assembly protein TadB
MDVGLGLAALGALGAAGAVEGLVRGRRRPLRPDRAERGFWETWLVVLWPQRFDRARLPADLRTLLRRAGPAITPDVYIGWCLRGLTLGVLAALAWGIGLGLVLGLPFGLGGAAFALAYGLRYPRSRLRRTVAARARALPFNMLPVLVVLRALLEAGVSLQEALERAARLEGVFAEVLQGFLARLQVQPVGQALQETAADLPDPQDPLARSFFRALELHLGRGHRLGEPLDALIRALTRELVERTEARAALCRRQAGLYGVAAVVGMVIAIVLPAVGLLLGGRP